MINDYRYSNKDTGVYSTNLCGTLSLYNRANDKVCKEKNNTSKERTRTKKGENKNE